MASSEEKDSGGFTVTDRRAFTPEGEQRPESSEPVAAADPAKPAGQTPPASGNQSTPTSGEPASSAPRGSHGASAAPGRSAPHLPPVDFPTFVLSLASSVLYHLGEGEAPGQKGGKNLPMAKHTVDILSMLQEKTQGNLNPSEAELLENLLCDLRLRYVAAAKS